MRKNRLFLNKFFISENPTVLIESEAVSACSLVIVTAPLLIPGA